MTLLLLPTCAVYYEQCSVRPLHMVRPLYAMLKSCTCFPPLVRRTHCQLHTYTTTHACFIQQAAPAARCWEHSTRLLFQLPVRMHQTCTCCLMLTDRHMAAAHPSLVAPGPALPCPATAAPCCYSADHGLGA